MENIENICIVYVNHSNLSNMMQVLLLHERMPCDVVCERHKYMLPVHLVL